MIYSSPLLAIFSVSVAQMITIDPVGEVSAVEGGNLTITCMDGVNPGAGLILCQNGVQLVGDNAPPDEVNA